MAIRAFVRTYTYMYVFALWLALVLAFGLCGSAAGASGTREFVVVVLAWMLLNPWWGGNPRILRSVERGGVYGEGVIIPWATTSITYPKTITRARSEHEVIAAAAGPLPTPIGSAHSFDDLFNSDHIILLDYCFTALRAGGGEPPTVVASAGCKVSEVRDFAYSKGYVMRGLGAIYQQTLGGGLATSLHNDEKLAFADEVLNVSYITAAREGFPAAIEHATGSEVSGCAPCPFIYLNLTIRLHQPFSVRRRLRHATFEGLEEVLDAVASDNAVAGGGQCIVPRSSAAGGAGKSSRWLVWRMDAAGASAPVGRPSHANIPADGFAFVLDNLITPMLTIMPWLAGAVGASHNPFVYGGENEDAIDWYYAQEHHPASVLPTGEIRTTDCRGLIDTLVAIAADYGDLSLLVRAAEAGACWVDYAVMPWAPGDTRRFHNAVAAAAGAARENLPAWEFHKGKIRPPLSSRREGYLTVLEFQRILWVVLVTAAFAAVAARSLYGEPGSVRIFRLLGAPP